LPEDTETLVRLNGVTQVVAGAMMSLGILRRTTATVLIGTLIPTTLAGHRFWEELDEDARSMQITHFAKNLGLLGGLLLIAAEGTPGRTSRRKKEHESSNLRIRRGQ
jgi:putative oxidoreductase